MKLKWGLIGILIGILSACQSSNQPMDITYPQPSINIPAEGQKPPIDSEVEIKTPVLKSDQIEEPINQTDENEERVDSLVSATVNQAVELLQLQMSEKQLAAIIHEPTEQQLAIVDHLDVIEYNQEPSDARLLANPQHIGSKSTIHQVTQEDDKLINFKIRGCLKNKLKIILCIGETDIDRRMNRTALSLEHQLIMALNNIKEADYKNIVIAYEPYWAIEIGRAHV